MAGDPLVGFARRGDEKSLKFAHPPLPRRGPGILGLPYRPSIIRIPYSGCCQPYTECPIVGDRGADETATLAERIGLVITPSCRPTEPTRMARQLPRTVKAMRTERWSEVHSLCLCFPNGFGWPVIVYSLHAHAGLLRAGRPRLVHRRDGVPSDHREAHHVAPPTTSVTAPRHQPLPCLSSRAYG